MAIHSRQSLGALPHFRIRVRIETRIETRFETRMEIGRGKRGWGVYAKAYVRVKTGVEKLATGLVGERLEDLI